MRRRGGPGGCATINKYQNSKSAEKFDNTELPSIENFDISAHFDISAQAKDYYNNIKRGSNTQNNISNILRNFYDNYLLSYLNDIGMYGSRSSYR